MSDTTLAPAGHGGIGSKTWSCILFDLDGTITDSAPGIWAPSSTPSSSSAARCRCPSSCSPTSVRPSSTPSARLGGMSVDEAQDALAVYRRRYNAGGLFDSSVYPRVPEILARIAEAGIPLSLATSKPESAATRVLEHYGLAQYFTVICGASEDEVRSAKADVVEEALRRLRALGVDLSSPRWSATASTTSTGPRRTGSRRSWSSGVTARRSRPSARSRWCPSRTSSRPSCCREPRTMKA